MEIVPAWAIPMAIRWAGLTPEQIDVWEIHEAFPAQALGVLREIPNQLAGFQVPDEKLSPNGAAVAFGHRFAADLRISTVQGDEVNVLAVVLEPSEQGAHPRRELLARDLFGSELTTESARESVGRLLGGELVRGDRDALVGEVVRSLDRERGQLG